MLTVRYKVTNAYRTSQRLYNLNGFSEAILLSCIGYIILYSLENLSEEHGKFIVRTKTKYWSLGEIPVFGSPELKKLLFHKKTVCALVESAGEKTTLFISKFARNISIRPIGYICTC